MKSFSTYIAELFNSPYKYKWKSTSGKHWQGDFFAGNNGELHYTVNISGKGFVANESERVWSVMFYLNDKTGHNTDTTGTGSASPIFATVIKMIEDFLKKEKPEGELNFVADKGASTGPADTSRSRLYQTLAKKLARKHGYDVETRNYDQSVDFSITPKKDRK
jgi:hypothetical protein